MDSVLKLNLPGQTTVLLAFGLMASTFMVLVVVPVLYAILHDLSPRVAAGITAPPGPPEQAPSNP